MDRKKTLDWITWIVNMLVALPCLGLISAIASGLFLDAINHGVRPEWDFWVCFFWIFLILTVLWGRHQYRILILKNARLTSKGGWKSLCILAGVVLFFSLLLFLLPAYLRSRQYAKYNEALRQHRESRDKQAELAEAPELPQEEKRTEE